MSKKRVRTVPRKAPKQERSQATVEAILAATARVLVKTGYDHASTNRIAEAAGVSVGSLYQYFPSKEALVAALVERHVEEMTRITHQTIAEVVEAPLERAAEELVRSIIEAHLVDPQLHKVLMEQVPRVGRLERLADFKAETCKLVRAALELRKKDVRPADLDLAAFVLTHACEGVVHAAVASGCRSGGAAPDKEALVREVAALLVGYLRR